VTQTFTYPEFLACLVSRQIADRRPAFVGAALPAIRAGTLLGHLMHGPSMRMLMSMTTTNVHDNPVIDRFTFVTDWRGGRWAEHYRVVEDIFGGMRRVARWRGFFVGALQVDPYGNTNLLGVAARDGRPAMRGAGSVGTPSVTAVAESFNILINRHTPSTFVASCDYVSCPGFLDGSDGARDRLGLRGGPELCISPLGVFDFTGDGRRMRLRSTHPGVAVDEVVAATGFDLAVPDTVEVTATPTEEELHVLRTRIDAQGELRRGEKPWPSST
jgi:glutaconate CoA-transferase subunit B